MNILILTCQFGMGHCSAAKAIETEIKKQLPDSTVIVKDFFEQALNFNSKYLYGFYELIIKRGKAVFNWVYRHTEDTEKELISPVKRILSDGFDKLYIETAPDVIISTVALCSRIVSEYKTTSGKKPLLISCITDLISHNDWINPCTDYYLVAAPKIREALIRKGIEFRKIIVSGIPVRDEFKIHSEPVQKRKRNLLIMGGGLGLLPRSRPFYSKLNNLNGIKTTIITGKNKALYSSIHGKYPNIEVLAYVNDVYKYMKNADLIISKPGGITLFEAIFSEIPLLLFKPFLEQEIRNGDFVAENKLGIVIRKKPQNAVNDIQRIMYNNDLLNSIRQNMQTLKAQLDDTTLPTLLCTYESRCE